MILPDKHIRLSESILGLSSFVLGLMDKPLAVDEVWQRLQPKINTDELPAHHSFDNFLLSLDLLFALGLINTNTFGLLEKYEISKTNI